jgi:hypothetical protein
MRGSLWIGDRVTPLSLDSAEKAKFFKVMISMKDQQETANGVSE